MSTIATWRQPLALAGLGRTELRQNLVKSLGEKSSQVEVFDSLEGVNLSELSQSVSESQNTARTEELKGFSKFVPGIGLAFAIIGLAGPVGMAVGLAGLGLAAYGGAKTYVAVAKQDYLNDIERSFQSIKSGNQSAASATMMPDGYLLMN